MSDENTLPDWQSRLLAGDGDGITLAERLVGRQPLAAESEPRHGRGESSFAPTPETHALTLYEPTMTDLPSRFDPADMAQAVSLHQRAQLEFAEQVGQLKAHEFHSKFANIAHLKILAEIKEGKLYKGMTLKNAQGDMVTTKTWDDFCAALGMARPTVDANLLNLEALGGEFLEKARAIGLGYRDINKLRKLPDDNRALVLGRVEVDAGDKEAIVDLIDELAGKHAKEKAALEAELDKQKHRVDALVEVETQGLKQEVAALVQERDALQKQIEDPDWAKTKQAAQAMWDALQAFRQAALTFERVRPKAGQAPVDVANSINTVFFSMSEVVGNIHRRFTDASFDGDIL